MEDQETIIIKDIIVKELDFDQIAVFFIADNDTQFQSLSQIINEREFLYDQYVDDNHLVIFELKFDDQILRHTTGMKVEENIMYLKAFKHYPDHVAAGYVINGYYHLGNKYRRLARP